MADIKQVIVVRSDLKMVRGKEDAQVGHACTAWLACRLKPCVNLQDSASEIHWSHDRYPRMGYFTDVELRWLAGLNKKVALVAHSEAELLEIEAKAKAAGILCYVVTDEGMTQFNGVKTKTCLALGPDLADKIDAITGHLKLR